MRYLSEEWIAAADAHVHEAAATAPSERLVIDQSVDGALDYRVTIAKHEASITTLESGDDRTIADARFAQHLDTARAVAQGTTDAHQAFLLGHIRFEGDIDVLIERRDAFDWLASALAPLIEHTTFSD